MSATRADVLFILAHSVSLVKNFFKFFQGFLAPNRLFRFFFKLVRTFRRELIQFTTHTRVCQALFSDLFPQGRPGSPRFLPVLVRFSCPLARRSDRISLTMPFVNIFFHFSFDFLRRSKHYLYIVENQSLTHKMPPYSLLRNREMTNSSSGPPNPKRILPHSTGPPKARSRAKASGKSQMAPAAAARMMGSTAVVLF